MIEGTTKTGFKFKIDPRVFEDWKIYDLVTKYDNANNIEKVQIIPDIVNMFLGNKGFDKLEKHIRSKNDGYCTFADLQNEVLEIMQSKEIKN